MPAIAKYKEVFNQLTTAAQRQQFIFEVKERHQDSITPEMRRFLNSCIKVYNEEIARATEYATKSIRELREVFKTFTTAAQMRQFILDIKGIYDASKNAEVRKFLNDCTRTHNSMVAEIAVDTEDSPEEGDVELAEDMENAEDVQDAHDAQDAGDAEDSGDVTDTEDTENNA